MQHRGGIVTVAWLAENLTVEDDLGVSAKHHRSGCRNDLQQSGAGLFPSHAAHVIVRGFARLALLGDFKGDHAERQPEAGQQFAATRGLRGEVQH